MLLIVIVIIAMIIVILNQIYKNTNHYLNKYKKFIIPFKNFSNKINLYAIGSAQAYCAYKFDEKHINFLNLSSNPQSLKNCYNIIKQYINEINNNSTVIITLPLAVFFFDEYKDDRNLIKYYSILKDKKVINNYKWYKTFIYKYFPIFINKKNILRAIKYILSLEFCKQKNINHIVVKLDEKKLNQLTINRIQSWKSLANIDVSNPDDNFERIECVEESTKILENIIKTLLENKCKVIIIIPPFTDVFNNMVNEKFMSKGYENILYDISNKYNVKILNYRKDSEFTNSYDLFENVDCLNEKGAYVFSKKLAKEII